MKPHISAKNQKNTKVINVYV